MITSAGYQPNENGYNPRQKKVRLMVEDDNQPARIQTSNPYKHRPLEQRMHSYISQQPDCYGQSEIMSRCSYEQQTVTTMQHVNISSHIQEVNRSNRVKDDESFRTEVPVFVNKYQNRNNEPPSYPQIRQADQRQRLGSAEVYVTFNQSDYNAKLPQIVKTGMQSSQIEVQ